MSAETLFTLFCTHSSILPIAVAAGRYRHLSMPVRIIVAWLLFSLATEIAVTDIITSVLRLPNIVYYNFYTLFEFSFLALFFYRATGQRWLQKSLIALSPLFLAFCFYDMAVLEGWHVLNALSLGLSSLLMLVLILVLLFETSHDLSLTFMEESPLFWILIGLLLYFAGTFFLYIFVNQMITADLQAASRLWVLNTFSLLVRNILFTVGILRTSRSY